MALETNPLNFQKWPDVTGVDVPRDYHHTLLANFPEGQDWQRVVRYGEALGLVPVPAGRSVEVNARYE